MTETLPLEQEFTVTNFTQEIEEILAYLDGEAFYQWVGNNALDPDSLGACALIGYLSVIRAEDQKRFDWAMYKLCYAKGLEEVVANFWVTNHMIAIDEIQEGA